MLAGIFLRDLQLNRLARMPQGCKQRRYRLAHLKINRPMLDLNDHILLKLTVKIAEVVVTRACPVRLRVFPVKMIVVNKTAIEHDSAVLFKRPGDHIGRFRRSAMIL